jgi:hypothetical protein
MSKRIYEESSYLTPYNDKNNIKRVKLYKTDYITINVNDKSFYQYSLSELSEFRNEIVQVINKLKAHKERIDSVLSIYC